MDHDLTAQSIRQPRFCRIWPGRHARERRDGARLRRADARPTRDHSAASCPGRDMLAQAATGTGKTAAFALPMLHHLLETPPSGPRRTRGLVLVPTRELAMQVAEAIHKYARNSGLFVVPVYGGASMSMQIRALGRGADIVVATPGRALDHLRRKTLDLEGLRVLVLDEADEMLDMGFAEDLDAILEATPEARQTALFSATMPPRILSIAAPAPARPAADHGRAREDGGRQAAARPAARLRRRTGAEARGAAARARHGEPRLGARLLPDAYRSGHARRDAERARLSRRGAARRDAAAPARQRDEPLPRRQVRPADRDRRRGPRARHRAALARVQLRLAVRRRGLRAPDRPHRPRRPRRHRHHAGRTARAPAAAHDRALHQAEDRGGLRANGGRSEGQADGGRRARRSATGFSRAIWTMPGWSSNRWPKNSTCSTWRQRR